MIGAGFPVSYSDERIVASWGLWKWVGREPAGEAAWGRDKAWLIGPHSTFLSILYQHPKCNLEIDTNTEMLPSVHNKCTVVGGKPDFEPEPLEFCRLKWGVFFQTHKHTALCSFQIFFYFPQFWGAVSIWVGFHLRLMKCQPLVYLTFTFPLSDLPSCCS